MTKGIKYLGKTDRLWYETTNRIHDSTRCDYSHLDWHTYSCVRAYSWMMTSCPVNALHITGLLSLRGSTGVAIFFVVSLWRLVLSYRWFQTPRHPCDISIYINSYSQEHPKTQDHTSNTPMAQLSEWFMAHHIETEKITTILQTTFEKMHVLEWKFCILI